jgi:cobalamin biosynthesis Mg chelatase CobN
MEEQEKPSRRHEAEKGTISDSEHADLKRTEDATAQPSDEAEDRNKSPEGGAGYEDDVVAVDPINAPSANSFMIQITAAMFVVVLLLVLAAVTGSTIVLLLALLSILPGIAVVLRAIFTMMSTD